MALLRAFSFYPSVYKPHPFTDSVKCTGPTTWPGTCSWCWVLEGALSHLARNLMIVLASCTVCLTLISDFYNVGSMWLILVCIYWMHFTIEQNSCWQSSFAKSSISFGLMQWSLADSPWHFLCFSKKNIEIWLQVHIPLTWDTPPHNFESLIEALTRLSVLGW